MKYILTETYTEKKHNYKDIKSWTLKSFNEMKRFLIELLDLKLGRDTFLKAPTLEELQDRFISNDEGFLSSEVKRLTKACNLYNKILADLESGSNHVEVKSEKNLTIQIELK